MRSIALQVVLPSNKTTVTSIWTKRFCFSRKNVGFEELLHAGGTLEILGWGSVAGIQESPLACKFNSAVPLI